MAKGYKKLSEEEFDRIKNFQKDISIKQASRIFGRSISVITYIYAAKDLADYREQAHTRTNAKKSVKVPAYRHHVVSDEVNEQNLDFGQSSQVEIELDLKSVLPKIPKMSTISAFYKGVYGLGEDNVVYKWETDAGAWVKHV